MMSSLTVFRMEPVCSIPLWNAQDRGADPRGARRESRRACQRERRQARAAPEGERAEQRAQPQRSAAPWPNLLRASAAPCATRTLPDRPGRAEVPASCSPEPRPHPWQARRNGWSGGSPRSTPSPLHSVTGGRLPKPTEPSAGNTAHGIDPTPVPDQQRPIRAG